MFGKSVKVAVAAVVAAGALAGCGGTPKAGTAALDAGDHVLHATHVGRRAVDPVGQLIVTTDEFFHEPEEACSDPGMAAALTGVT